MPLKQEAPEGFALTHIDNQTLAMVAEIGARAKKTGQLVDSEAALIYHTAGTIAAELLQRRKNLEILHDLSDPKVVRLFDLQDDEAGA
ncbi:hypothetical protein [Mameliella alba]|uniref:hypothetical protein n=1 Tax=Mameliella alba TaxID=561184 RepID=UPI000B5325C4|nr:hypothetical protein [Mameliella alba]OWV39424.1 hypothetical protein CDZ95_26215 [Mameliella alba]